MLIFNVKKTISNKIAASSNKNIFLIPTTPRSSIKKVKQDTKKEKIITIPVFLNVYIATFKPKTKIAIEDIKDTDGDALALKIKIKEIGHTLTKSYLQSLTGFLELNIKPSEERIVSTFGESLTDLVLLGIKEKYAILIKTHFKIPKTKVEGEFILLVAIESLSKVIEAIKHKIE